MDYNSDNSGCGNLIQILFGVAIISIASYLLFQNPVLVLGMIAIAYVPPIGMMGFAIYLGVMSFLLYFMQDNLRQARWQRGQDSTKYRDLLFFLMILPVLGAFVGLAYLGFFYSLMMLAWSFFVVIYENR